MKHLSIPVSVALVASLLSSTAFALDYQHGDDDYSDAVRFSIAERAAISVLTDVGAVSGNPDPSAGSGQAPSFAPARTLNRAEFTKIALLSMGIDVSSSDASRCFPDVPANAWFSRYVCKAKADGIVEGNPDGLFHPERAVNDAEAMKILVELAGYPLPEPAPNERWAWYTGYLKAAAEHGVQLPGNVSADTALTRGQMARLAAAFVAEAEGELEEYRDAERGEFIASSSSSTSSSRTSSSSTSVGVGSIDPDSNMSIASDFLFTGEVSPVIGAVDFFAAQEPIDVDTIRVRFSSDPSSIQQVRVYEEETGKLLGTSFHDGSNDYEIAVAPGTIVLPHREEAGVYVRVLLKPADGGASGGQIVQIQYIEMDGDGVWSDSEYTVTSTETFLAFETTPAVITGFAPATSLSSSVFVAGPSVTLWDFNVLGRSTDSDFEPALTSMIFRVAKSSNVTISDAQLTVPGSGAETDCTITTGFITCSSIPASVGTIDDVQRIRLIVDVEYSGAGGDPFLQATLQEGGTPTSAGDIEWTDGTTTYDWLGIDEPIARGILYK